MSTETYANLLRDPRWQRRRLEILQRSDFSCEECEDKERTLHVHHKVYRKGVMPWEYTDGELQVLCERCHEDKTRLLNAIKRGTGGMTREMLSHVLGYCLGQWMLEFWDDEKMDHVEIELPDPETAWGLLDCIHLLIHIRFRDLWHRLENGKISVGSIKKLGERD
jgi:hypothetical protein